MQSPLSEDHWSRLRADGYLRLPDAFAASLGALQDAARSVCECYPYGFADPRYYTGSKPVPLTAQTARPDGRVLVPYVGFLDKRILAVLANPHVHDMLERIVGKDFYLSNTWYQAVPPGTSRLSYHKDTRGSISFNILLDEIETGMGSTCLVPGSHINTPPAAYCMSDIHKPHPREIDITGKPGDLVLFSTEAWHARSKNASSRTTRRFFYNFYSRSSRNTTTWAGIIAPEKLEEIRDSMPREYRHMFDIDAARTTRLADVDGMALRKWALRKSSSNELLRDMAYAACTYGRPTDNPREAGALLPYTTRLTEARPYNPIQYFSQLKPVPSLKNLYVFLRAKMRALLPASGPAPVPQVQAE